MQLLWKQNTSWKHNTHTHTSAVTMETRWVFFFFLKRWPNITLVQQLSVTEKPCRTSAAPDKPAASTTLSRAKGENTLYIRGKCGREAGVWLSEEAWGEIGNFQWTATNSMDRRKHCWKHIIGYLKVPHQEEYKDVNRPGWDCSHILWEFWKDIQDSPGTVFNIQI